MYSRSGQDPLRRRRDRNRYSGLDGEPLDSEGHGLREPGVSGAVPVSRSTEASGAQPTRNRHQPSPLNMSPTNEKSLALAAAMAQANGPVLPPDSPSPPASNYSSLYPSSVSAAIQEALDNLRPPQISSQHLRVVGGSPFIIPASLPATPVLIASFPTTPCATQTIDPTTTSGGDIDSSPMPISAGQSPYLKDRRVTSGVAPNVELYPQGSPSSPREPRDDEGFQMDLGEEFNYPEVDIVQIEPLEAYRLPSPSTMPPSPSIIVSSRPPTQPLVTKSSKGHHLELDISGLARRFTSSSQRSSMKSLPPSNVPSAASALADSPTAVEPSTHTSTGGNRFLRKAQSQSRLRDMPASGTSSVSSQSSLSWIGSNSAGSGSPSRLPGLPRRQKSFQNLSAPPVPIPSSFLGLRHAGPNYSAASGQSGSPPDERSKGKDKDKVEKEKVTSPRKRFFNSGKYASGNSLVLEKEYAGLIGKKHEVEAPLPTQPDVLSPVNTRGPPSPHPQHLRPRTAPQRMNGSSTARGPPFAPSGSTSPPNGTLDDEWASHFSSPLPVSGLIIHEPPSSFILGTGGTVPGLSPPLSKQSDEDNASPSAQESPTTSLLSLKSEERRAPRQHIIPPSELLRLGEEAREHTSALHSPPSLSRARSTGASFEYPVMSGFAPNGTPVGFAALRARSTSTSRLPSDSAALASPNLGLHRTRSQRAGSAGTNMSLPILTRPFGTYASRSISSPTIDLGGAVQMRSSSIPPPPATKARRPSTAGSLQISTPLCPLLGFSSPNGGTQSLPPPPRPRLPSLRMGGSVLNGSGPSVSTRTSTSTEFISPMSALTSAPTRSSGASWGRTTSSPSVSRPPSSASLIHPPVHTPGVVSAASGRQRSVLKKPSFLEIGDDEDDTRIKAPEGEVSVAGRPRRSRTNTSATSRTNSSQNSSGGLSRAPSSASAGMSVHRVPSKASLRGPQPPVNVVQSDSFLDLDMGSMGMDTIRQHPDELEPGENERVLGYRF